MTTSDEIHYQAWRWPVALSAAILWAALSCAAWLTQAEVAAAAEKENTPAETDSAGQQEGQPPSEEADQAEEEKKSDANESSTSGDQAEEAAMQEESAGEENVSEESDRPVEEEPTPDETSGAKTTTPVEEKKRPSKKKKQIIGATAVLMEKRSEMLFRARVDSGAKSCSLHIEKMIIEDEAEKMADNIGKLVRFKIQNGKDKTWLTEKIAGYVIIKTSENRERRYKVPLTLRWKNIEKTVLVTLNDRKKMEYPLLLGRNFLKGDFLVDVDMDNDD